MTSDRPRAGGRYEAADTRQLSERGETTMQIVIIVPVLMLMILLGVQAAIWFHAANVAQVAASRGAGVGSTRSGGEAAATTEAEHVVLDNQAELALVFVEAGTETVSVSVTVEIPHLVPFFPDRVTRTQTEPIERFVSEADRG
jgi:TadE-like protein